MTEELNCSHCGIYLGSVRSGAWIRCPYCGNESQVNTMHYTEKEKTREVEE